MYLKIPLTLNYKPIPFCEQKGTRRIGVTPVALHWAGDSMPVQTVCPNIIDIELTIKVKIPDEICRRLFQIFPNITRLRLDCPKGDCIDISTVNQNLKQLRLYALKMPDSCVDCICAMHGLESICFGHTTCQPIPQSVRDKLMLLFTEKIKEHPDWVQSEAHSFWFNY